MSVNAPNSKPGTSIENQTGSWRTHRPVVNEPECIKCGICHLYCPEDCISGSEQEKKPAERTFPKINYDYCKGCGICANECPKKCIKMEEEEK
ncbi:MAG: 4Fe-4S binding protein [archaeon]